MNASNPAVITIIMATVLGLLIAGQAVAFDYDALLSASPDVHQCMEDKLGIERMQAVRNGVRPDKRSDRKKIWKAYEGCLASQRNITAYDGPLFDAMSQIDETVDMGTAIANVRAARVSKLALFARSRKKLHQNEQAILNLAKRNPDLIVLGAPKYFQLSGDVTDAYIKATVQGIRKHGYRFIGEILYTHGDKGSGKQYASGERYVDPSRPGTVKLLKAISPLNIPLMAHWEPYAPERDFPRFHALYEAWPNQTFILPHMGFSSPEQVDEFMSRHPNLHLVTSKKERVMGDFADPKKQAMIGSAMLDGHFLRPKWKEILIKYQDRILFGTDPHMKKLWMKYGEVVDRQRLVLGQLPREVADKIAYKNAEKMYGVPLGR